MLLRDVLKGLDYLEINVQTNVEIDFISDCSKNIEENTLFIAICGDKYNGNDFILEAIEKGAKAILTDIDLSLDIPFIKVSDVRKAKAKIASNFYKNPSNSMFIIGVTGTNGKTTTTYLVKHILEKNAYKTGLIGTNQNTIGKKCIVAERTTEDALIVHKMFREMLDIGITFCVMEVSSHALSLDRVSEIDFIIGAYTNISRDHLDFHKTMDEYAKAKSKLFEKCKKSVINLDDKYAEIMIENSKGKVLTFGIENEKADLQAKNVKLFADKVQFDALYMNECEQIEISIPGRFSVYNALTAIGVCLSIGLNISSIGNALKDAKGVKGRAEIVPFSDEFTVIIDYAHSPDGVLNILKTVKDFAKGRIITVFGAGGDRDKEKRPLMAKAASKYSDVLIITSDNPRTEDPLSIICDIVYGLFEENANYKIITDRKRAIHYALSHAKKDDVIVLMGKGHETYQEINGVKNHFDEREIIADYKK